MSKVSVNPPKTPVTEGSGDKSPATLPNVCKMPGPPAPFVPTPLPNIGQSSDTLTDGTTTVKFEGKKVAIKGAYYMSKLSGDMASKGTGGGLISSTTEGKTKFVAPGSMNVKADGKNIQLLGDAMTNDGSNPTNSGTLPGNIQIIGPPSSVTIKQIKDALCKRFCDYVKKTNKRGPKGGWQRKKGVPMSSNALEKSLSSNYAWKKAGIFFRTRFGKIFPDVVRVLSKPTWNTAGKFKTLITGKVTQCFDFKLPNDYPRPGQKAKQTKLGGKKVIILDVNSCNC